MFVAVRPSANSTQQSRDDLGRESGLYASRMESLRQMSDDTVEMMPGYPSTGVDLVHVPAPVQGRLWSVTAFTHTTDW